MADSPAPNCCPVDTRWKLLRNILEALNGGGPTPPADAGILTDPDGQIITDDEGNIILPD